MCGILWVSWVRNIFFLKVTGEIWFFKVAWSKIPKKLIEDNEWNYFTTVLKISKLQEFVWKTMQRRDWMAKVVYLIQMLPTFGGRCNRYFWDIRLEILSLPNFNMLFQLVLTRVFKSELFSCLPKVGHMIKSCKEPIGILLCSNRKLIDPEVFKTVHKYFCLQ